MNEIISVYTRRTSVFILVLSPSAIWFTESPFFWQVLIPSTRTLTPKQAVCVSGLRIYLLDSWYAKPKLCLHDFTNLLSSAPNPSLQQRARTDLSPMPSKFRSWWQSGSGKAVYCPTSRDRNHPIRIFRLHPKYSVDDKPLEKERSP